MRNFLIDGLFGNAALLGGRFCVTDDRSQKSPQKRWSNVKHNDAMPHVFGTTRFRLYHHQGGRHKMVSTNRIVGVLALAAAVWCATTARS